MLILQTVESTAHQKAMMNILIKESFSVGHCNKLLIYPLYPLPQTTGLNTWPQHGSWLAVLRLCVCVFLTVCVWKQNKFSFIFGCHLYPDRGLISWQWPQQSEPTWAYMHVCNSKKRITPYLTLPFVTMVLFIFLIFVCDSTNTKTNKKHILFSLESSIGKVCNKTCRQAGS